MEETGKSDPSPAEDLIKNLRALVQEENRKPAEQPPPAQKPGWQDLVWLAVLAADAALLYYWFPEGAKGPLEFLRTLLPWLLGGTFVVLNDWFRDRLLGWSRLRSVRIAQVALLAFGIILGVKIFRVTPDVRPDGTILKIDPETDGEAKATHEALWLTLHHHTIALMPGKDDTNVDTRKIELPWWRVPLAAFTKEGGNWPRVYRIDIDTPQVAKVTIIPRDFDFDADFLELPNLQAWNLTAESTNLRDWHLLPGDTFKKSVSFKSSGTEATDAKVLPFGRYWIGMEGCTMEELEVKAFKLNHFQLHDCKKLSGAGS
jgi:hypothetical protein